MGCFLIGAAFVVKEKNKNYFYVSTKFIIKYSNDEQKRFL